MSPSGTAAGARVALEAVSVQLGGATVLRDVDLVVGAGEQVAVVGPSGAGKTTLLRLCNATVRPARGRVLLDGAALDGLRGAALRRARAGVGFVHQDHALVPNLRVLQNVAAGRLGRRGLVAGLRGVLWPARGEVAAIHALLERVGIAAKLYARADSLSGGQQQRVALARALWQEPKLLLADEPVASVDPARARDVLRLLVDVAAERGLTLVVSLHDLDLARELFPRLVGVRAGSVVLDAAPRTVAPRTFDELYALSGAQADEASA